MRLTRAGGLSLLAAAAFASCAAPAPSVGPTTSVVPAPTASASSTQPSRTTPAVQRPTADLALLDAVPADIEGVALTRDLDTTSDIIAGGGLPPQVEALAVGLYVGPGSSTSDDFAITNIARLRPDAFTDAWFRSWRETYDEAACEPSGGVAAGVAEAELGGHLTHIGSCRGGVHTYHVHLEDPDRIVSITAAGEARFGERVVAGLTE